MNSVAPDVHKVSLTIAIHSRKDEDAVRRVYPAWQERCPVYLALTEALPGGDVARRQAALSHWTRSVNRATKS
jgi:hypothetical protein